MSIDSLKANHPELAMAFSKAALLGTIVGSCSGGAEVAYITDSAVAGFGIAATVFVGGIALAARLEP